MKKNCACPVCKRWQFQEGILNFKNLKFVQEWTKTLIQFGDEHVMQCVGEFLICDVFYFGRNSPISSKQKPTMANGSKGEGTLFVYYELISYYWATIVYTQHKKTFQWPWQTQTLKLRTINETENAMFKSFGPEEGGVEAFCYEIVFICLA